MAKSPLISVLLPVRDGAATLLPALRSIINQTVDNFELLVIDDGSRDSSVELARGMGDSRIRVLGDAQSRGLAARLNQGVEVARGKYIARMDADDLAFPERFARQLDFLEANADIDLVGCRAVVFHERSGIVGLYPFAPAHQAICARPWHGFHLAHPTWMGRASWFRQHPYRIPEVRRAEDQELLLRSYLDSRYACLPSVLLAYRLRPYSLRRVLAARRSFCAAQCIYFSRRSQWFDVGRVLVTTSGKLAFDILAALPRAEWIFNYRMSEPVPLAVLTELTALQRIVGSL